MTTEFFHAVIDWVGFTTRTYVRRVVSFLLLKVGLRRVGLPDDPTDDDLSLIVRDVRFPLDPLNYYVGGQFMRAVALLADAQRSQTIRRFDK
jgi:hypothetical protein